MNHCANCSAIIKDGTGRQFGAAWLDDWCLNTLANRGYLVGADRTGGSSRPAITPLTFQRNGHLVTYFAPVNYWLATWDYKYPSRHVRAWLESLPDSELQPFKEHKGKEDEKAGFVDLISECANMEENEEPPGARGGGEP